MEIQFVDYVRLFFSVIFLLVIFYSYYKSGKVSATLDSESDGDKRISLINKLHSYRLIISLCSLLAIIMFGNIALDSTSNHLSLNNDISIALSSYEKEVIDLYRFGESDMSHLKPNMLINNELGGHGSFKSGQALKLARKYEDARLVWKFVPKETTPD